MSKATLFAAAAAAAASSSIAALCFCWTAGFLRKKTPPSPNLSSSSHVHFLPAASKVGLSLLQDPAPELSSPLVEDIKDEANVTEILVELETHEGYQAQLKAEEASGCAVMEVSLESFDCAGESQAEVVVVQDAFEEGQDRAEVSELVKVSAQDDCLDGGRDPKAEEEGAGDEGEEVVEDGKLVEVSGWDCLVGGVDSEDEQVFLSEEGGGEAVKEHLKSDELEVPIEGPTTEANLVVEVINGTIFYTDPITKSNQGFSLLQFTSLDEAKQGLSMLKNSLVRVAPNHTQASLVEVVNQTIFYTDPVTNNNNGFSLLQFETLDKAERGVSVFMNRLVNDSPCGVAPCHDNKPVEEVMVDVSDRGRRFPPPDEFHVQTHRRASRHATQRESEISRMVATEREGHRRAELQRRTMAPGPRKMNQMYTVKSRGGTVTS